MAVQVGTHDLASLRENRFTSVAEFGEQQFEEILRADVAAHQRVVSDMDSDLVVQTPDRQRIFGISGDGQFMETDEYSRTPTQMYQGGSTVGFPLKLYQFGVGWTARTIAKMSVGEAAEVALGVQLANVRKHRAEIKKALYLSANYTFRDRLDVPQLDLAVKRLINADSMGIPNGPDGGTFNAATHTHYTGSATLTATALSSLITNVTEHGNGGRIVVAINHIDADAVAALAGFVPAQLAGVVPATNAAYAQGTTNPANQFDRFLGRFKAAEVWIKPWAIANYIVAYDALARERPLVRRIDRSAEFVGMRLVSEHEVYPLRTAHYEDSFGYGVWGRSSAAVLYFASGTYADPTITE
jgi:hypothetical protein